MYNHKPRENMTKLTTIVTGFSLIFFHSVRQSLQLFKKNQFNEWGIDKSYLGFFLNLFGTKYMSFSIFHHTLLKIFEFEHAHPHFDVSLKMYPEPDGG